MPTPIRWVTTEDQQHSLEQTSKELMLSIISIIINKCSDRFILQPFLILRKSLICKSMGVW